MMQVKEFYKLSEVNEYLATTHDIVVRVYPLALTGASEGSVLYSVVIKTDKEGSVMFPQESTVNLTLSDMIPKTDYLKLIGYCIPYSAGNFYEVTSDGKRTFHIHPSHTRGVSILLKKLGIEPQLAITEIAKGVVLVKPDPREDAAYNLIDRNRIACQG